jgi:hypothetical protein
MYDCLYMCSEGEGRKKIKQLRNTCMITHTPVPRGKEEKKKENK